ncbi:GntR family transcriptional regulator [Achromobacter xylosoxidans]
MSELLGVTRNPVRQALRELESEGLVARFDGRGMLAGGASETPLRQSLTPGMLGLGDESEPVRKAQGWEHIYHAVEHDVVHLSGVRRLSAQRGRAGAALRGWSHRRARRAVAA